MDYYSSIVYSIKQKGLEKDLELIEDESLLPENFLQTVVDNCTGSNYTHHHACLHIPIIRFLRCIKLNLQELGTAFYNDILDRGGHLCTKYGGSIKEFVEIWGMITIMEYGSVEAAKWVHKLKDWNWQEPGHIMNSMLRRGDFLLIDWLMQCGALYHLELPDDYEEVELVKRNNQSKKYGFVAAYQLKVKHQNKRKIRRKLFYSFADFMFTSKVVIHICNHHRLDYLKLFTQRLRESCHFESFVMKFGAHLNHVTDILTVADEDCACYLLSESVLTTISYSQFSALFACLFLDKPKAASLLIDSYGITATQVTAFINQKPKCMEALMWRFTESTCRVAEQKLGLNWQELKLASMNIFYNMLRNHPVITPNVRSITTVALLPDSIWDFLLIYPCHWDRQYSRPKYKFHSHFKYCCDVYHFILSKKIGSLSKSTVECVAQSNPFQCIRLQATMLLPHCAKTENDSLLSPADIDYYLNNCFMTDAFSVSTPNDYYYIKHWLEYHRIQEKWRCSQPCCPLHCQ